LATRGLAPAVTAATLLGVVLGRRAAERA
jgi:hypothetical protein